MDCIQNFIILLPVEIIYNLDPFCYFLNPPYNLNGFKS